MLFHIRYELGVPELMPVLDSQPAGDRSRKPGGRLPLISVKIAVTFSAGTELYGSVTSVTYV